MRQCDQLVEVFLPIHRLQRPRRFEIDLRLLVDWLEDDDLRLVYADYLLERGDPRGEFIQLQYQRLAGGLTAEQEEREKTLQEEHFRTWLQPILSGMPADSIGLQRMPVDRNLINKAVEKKLARTFGRSGADS